MLLSIIVPAYNVERYIERCIRSLEAQDIPQDQYEIILTNDGSPDQTRKIVEKLKLKFTNIILINQENQGVSMARNNAIAHAQGKYIMPVDPDDYVLPNTLKNALMRAENDNLDVLYLGFEIFDADGKSLWQTNYQKQSQQIFTGVEGYFAARGKDVRDPDRSWAILYRKSMMDHFELRYPKDVPFLEDGCFLTKVFSVAQRVGFSNNPFHQRTTSEGSATVSGVYYSEKAAEGFLKAAADIRTFGKKHIFTQQQHGLINHGIANFVLLAIFPMIAFKSAKIFTVMKMIRVFGFSKLETNGVVEPYLKFARYFNVSPYFLLLMYTKEMAFKKLFHD